MEKISVDEKLHDQSKSRLINDTPSEIVQDVRRMSTSTNDEVWAPQGTERESTFENNKWESEDRQQPTPQCSMRF